VSDDRNVFGGELAPCSTDPTTGYLRDGCCRRVEGEHDALVAWRDLDAVTASDGGHDHDHAHDH